MIGANLDQPGVEPAQSRDPALLPDIDESVELFALFQQPRANIAAHAAVGEGHPRLLVRGAHA